MLTTPEAILIGVIAATLVLIFSNRIRADVVAVLVLLALSAAGIVNLQEALSGFSSTTVITIIGLFIVTHALEETGVVQWIGNRLMTIGGGSEVRLIFLFMAAGAALSLIMNNIAAGAVLLPAAATVARDSNVRLSKLLIPLSFGTLLGGMATYFTTANIIMSGILISQGQHGLSMLDFVGMGGMVLVWGMAYMMIVGRRLLPERESVGQNVSPRSLSKSLQQTYQLDERLWEVRVLPGSKLDNVMLSQSNIGGELGLTVIAIWHNHNAILAPEPSQMIRANDYLLVLGREERVSMMENWGLVVGRENGISSTKRDYSVDLTEIIIPPRSTFIGKTLKDLRFRNKYGLTSVALWREGRSYRTDVGLFPLEVGDAILMVGPAARIRSLAQERDVMMLESSHIYRPPRPQKAIYALIITALVLLVSILELVPIPLAMLAGAMGIVLSGCLNMDEAYRSVEWRVVFLIAGMTSASAALINTGLAERIGDLLIMNLSPYGPVVFTAGMYLLTMLITQVMGGQVSSLLVGPVAVTAALQLGVNPQAVSVAVAIACSSSFLTPVAHPVNVLMMGPGGYTFSDFLKVGFGLTLVCFFAMLAGLGLFWGIGL